MSRSFSENAVLSLFVFNAFLSELADWISDSFILLWAISLLGLAIARVLVVAKNFILVVFRLEAGPWLDILEQFDITVLSDDNFRRLFSRRLAQHIFIGPFVA